MIVNSSSLKESFKDTLCGSDSVCASANLSHLKWKPLVKDGKVLRFKTGDERESSSELSGPFVEVFSGPNAPLGRAVARRILAVSGKGVGNELNSLAQFLEKKDSNGPLPSSNVLGIGNETWLRRAAVQSAKQPSYGKRVQLISDSLNDPEIYLNSVLGLVHPFDNFSTLNGIIKML